MLSVLRDLSVRMPDYCSITEVFQRKKYCYSSVVFVTSKRTISLPTVCGKSRSVLLKNQYYSTFKMHLVDVICDAICCC